MPRMRWRPGLLPGPRWGSSRRSPRPSSRLGRGTPPPQEPHPLAAFSPRSLLGTFGASFLAYTHLYFFSNTPLPIAGYKGRRIGKREKGKGERKAKGGGGERSGTRGKLSSWNRAADWLRPALLTALTTT